MPCQILFIGDSHTRGRLGSNYVEKLQHMVKDSNLQMLAFGVDGEPTEKIAQRVAPIFKHHPQPAAVFVLAGTNDCIAQEHSVMQWFYTKAFKLSRPCSLDYALENLQEMLRQIRKDAPDAKVTVITLPPLTEDPSSPATQRVEQYNSKLRQMIKDSFPVVQIADYYTAAVQYLQQHHPASQQYKALANGAQPAQQEYSMFDMCLNPSYTFSMLNFLGRQLVAVAKQRLLGISWDGISSSRGLHLLTDWVHMNDTAAGLLARVLLPHVQDL